MVSSFASDPLIRFALWAAAAMLLLAAAMTLDIAWLRLRIAVRSRREARFLARWRPVLLEAVDAVPEQMLRIRRRNWLTFLALWNSFHESLRGAARHRLNAVALRLRMDVAAREILGRGEPRDQIMAAVTLGHLGDVESWGALERLARSDHSSLSLAAARALVLIDPSRAIELLIPQLSSRADWPLARVKAILRETEAASVSQPLVSAMDLTPPDDLPRLITLMDCATAAVVTPELRRLLESSSDEEVLVACLKSDHVARDRTLLANLARHRSWQVRTQAARVLGQIASRGDEKLLTSMLSDPVWWVRYRAAQALAALPFLSQDDLWRLRFLVTDKFAQNMLDQVVAERRATEPGDA